MTDTSSWWARKLGRAPQGSQYPEPAYRPSPGPTGASTATQELEVEPAIIVDPATGGKMLNWRSAGFINASQAAKQEKDTCPNCGSSNFFSRRQQSVVTQNGMASPMPQCFECSYNGRFQIFGGG